MSNMDIKKTLEKQLQLLSERSAGTKERDYMELAELTNSMCLLAEAITHIWPGYLQDDQ